jgi:hypothetical protein
VKHGVSEGIVKQPLLESLAISALHPGHGSHISPPDAKTPGIERTSYAK